MSDLKNQHAFPRPSHGDHGMNMRQYYSGLALQGMLASYPLQIDVQQNDPRYNGRNFAKVMAKNAVEFADALIAELEKSPTP